MKEKEIFEKKFKLLLDNTTYGSKLKNDTIDILKGEQNK